MKRLAIAAAFAAALAFPAIASANEYELDTSHTHVGFKVSHLGFSETYGVFKNVSGKLELDEKNPEASTVDVYMDVNSLDSGWEKRDEHLKGKDFFNVEEFPSMNFMSAKVELTGKDTAKVTGNLTLLGVSKPVTLDVKLNKAGPSPMNKDKIIAGFSATGTLKRSDFGMTTYLPAIGDEVTLIISVEAVKQ